MALIKCPECGKEISDAAVKCPNCGYPVKAEQKKKEKENKTQKLVECPECHNMVESQYKTCPCCGYTLKGESEIAVEKIKSTWNNKKVRMIIITGIVVLVAIVVGVWYKSTHNEFTQYTKYIGKNYKKLPDGLKHKDLEDDDDTWMASTGKSNTKLFGMKGFMGYDYSKLGMSEYGTKANEVYGVTWSVDDPSNKEYKEIRSKLVKTYGNYDDKEITDWQDEDSLDVGEKYTEYSWEDKKGMDIRLTIYDEDDDDKEIEWVEIGWTKAK